jgi:hypothetical protein
MREILNAAIGPFLGAMFGCGFGVIGFWLQRRWTARDAFHLTVQEQIAKLQIITKAEDPAKPSLTYKAQDAFLQETIVVLIAASRRVKRHVGTDAVTNLDRALDDLRTYQEKYPGMTGRCLSAIEEVPDFSELILAKLEVIDQMVTDNLFD